MAAKSLNRRTLVAALGAIAAFGARPAAAQADKRNAQAMWNLQHVDGKSLDGLILLKIFRGYFPLPAHLTLDISAPPYQFVNFDRQFKDDAQDGAVIAAKLTEMGKHPLMTWVRRTAPDSRNLRYGLVIERRQHPAPAAGRPQIRSVLFSDKTHFVCVVGPVEPLWQDMIDAYARLPRVK